MPHRELNILNPMKRIQMNHNLIKALRKSKYVSLPNVSFFETPPQSKHKQYGLRHHVTSIIHADMGNTMISMET